jgi:hypothetical protein
MTRVSSYGLYGCPSCGQIHIKPNYGSISVYVPNDISIGPTTIIVCHKCKSKNIFQRYGFIGNHRKMDTKTPTYLKRLIRKFRNDPYVEFDVRKLYPYLKSEFD